MWSFRELPMNSCGFLRLLRLILSLHLFRKVVSSFLFVSDRTAFGRERFRVAVAPHKCLITMTFTEAIDSEELHFRRLVDRLTAVVLLQGLQKRPSGRFCVRITTVQNVQIFRPNFKVRM